MQTQISEKFETFYSNIIKLYLAALYILIIFYVNIKSNLKMIQTNWMNSLKIVILLLIEIKIFNHKSLS